MRYLKLLHYLLKINHLVICILMSITRLLLDYIKYFKAKSLMSIVFFLFLVFFAILVLPLLCTQLEKLLNMQLYLHKAYNLQLWKLPLVCLFQISISMRFFHPLNHLLKHLLFLTIVYIFKLFLLNLTFLSVLKHSPFIVFIVNQLLLIKHSFFHIIYFLLIVIEFRRHLVVFF